MQIADIIRHIVPKVEMNRPEASKSWTRWLYVSATVMSPLAAQHTPFGHLNSPFLSLPLLLVVPMAQSGIGDVGDDDEWCECGLERSWIRWLYVSQTTRF